ncbi:MAG TPA: nucleotidyl transferase AbiEii/AbiGii toxin family protein [Spirochaetota bacterium]|nr:MAG: hypothetical protein BWX91_01766 [Spirochaetes bacterium ADurb.Bin133]HNZ26690.1 nucleotidyl transferase AbiEii/AbiGii toxin family protein [Spirochaetota bacterium]HPY87806.1 nucleotidyl transferase AbiEii/AbiGii toxin family protein [Spirochaetota bacterium]HQB60501.1 nucleotidyl transferase AbiEii/AbiGii toxin family protein [Spirochaetota bacterium]
MENLTDYNELYSEQDFVLGKMKSLESGFYLTGGTCLHRFYINYRYSDDLDFFCADNDLFRDYSREIIESFKSSGKIVKTIADARDFIRIEFNNMLKIDFVNDRVYRYGKIEKSEEGYRIDNIYNILTNKITAVIGRDEPKDVFDICSISMNYDFNWAQIIEIAGKKCVFDKDLFVDRLQTFPEILFDMIRVREGINLDDIKKSIPGIIENILDEKDNFKI